MRSIFKVKKINKGFTVTELIVGLSIGIVVLTGLMSFYFRSTKMISDQQAIVKNLSQLQFIMNKIVQDIKEANTQAPGTGSTVTPAQWASLPYMGYGRTYPNSLGPHQPPDNTYPKEFPVYPVAYKFGIYQAGTTIGDPKDCYPKQDPSTPLQSAERESNSLVFYKVLNNQIVRVIYYTELQAPFTNGSPTPLKMYSLKKRIQYPPESIGLLLESLGSGSSESVILKDIKFVQFTYPVLTQKLALTTDPDYNSGFVDNDLINKILYIKTNEPTAFKRDLKQSVLINEYRNNIKINIATAGPQIGDRRPIAFELSTEVNIRN